MDRKLVEVDANALYRVLMALNGPAHHIRELQAIRDIDELVGEKNPINQLCEDYNRWADAQNTEPSNG